MAPDRIVEVMNGEWGEGAGEEGQEKSVLMSGEKGEYENNPL